MPLINCPECDKEVADKARDCPSCGHRLNKPKRSVFGKICLWLFILFNIGMPVWIISTCAAVGETVNTGTDAEAAGAVIGGGIAGAFLVVIWLVGTIILGIPALLTRAK